MTITGPDARSAAPGQAVVDAAMLVLERMGLTPADLLAAPAARPAAPTFAEYIPVVSALVSDGCRRAYGSYWNRVTDRWGSRCIDEPTPSEIRQLVQHVRANVVPRRNSRGGRSAAEHLIAALRCMYKSRGGTRAGSFPARRPALRFQMMSAIAAVSGQGYADQRVMTGAAGLENFTWQALVIGGPLDKQQHKAARAPRRNRHHPRPPHRASKEQQPHAPRNAGSRLLRAADSHRRGARRTRLRLRNADRRHPRPGPRPGAGSRRP